MSSKPLLKCLVSALLTIVFLGPNTAHAQSFVPEKGAVLKLVSAEDGDNFPKYASDIGLATAVIGSVVGASFLSYYADKRDLDPYLLSPLVDFGLAFAVNNLLTFGLKHTVQRARPYAYSNLFQSEASDIYSESERNDAYHSFPSGHTSNTAAATFAVATSLAIHLPSQENRPMVIASLYSLSTILTGFVGYMRIKGGYHFYSDVISGALLGAIAGTVTPIVHHLLVPDSSELSMTANPLSRSTVPMSIHFRGRF
ncbi:MAG: phosphatase PAP2 family protein [Myxococcota bacterium]|nr:phosphatase PAP2 family protein [Myxococcota bacterium]